jgi:predicted dehydrogenase
MDLLMNVLIVGGGSIGERHLRCFQQTGACQVALCEPLDERRARLVAEYNLQQAFASLDQAVEQSWDAAVICTPANLHVDHALRLAPQTGAFLIEKPLSTKLDDVAKLEDVARQKPLEVAYVYRAHPAVHAVRRLLAEGQIGQLRQVVASSGQHFPTFRPAYREIYYRDRATGGGAVQDAATHMFDAVQHIGGRFAWVWCDYGHQVLPGVEVEDTVHLAGRLDGGQVMVSVTLNQFQAPNETWLQLNGDQGSLRIHFHEHRYGLLRHGDAAWQWSEPLVHERDDLFRRQAAAFLEVAAGRAPSVCNLASARHTLEVNLAALASAGERRVAIEAN